MNRSFLLPFIAIAICCLGAKPDDKPANEKKDDGPRVFTSWQEMYREVPEDKRPDNPSKMNDIQMEVVNNVLAEKVANQRAKLRFPIDGVEITKAGKYAGLPRIIGQAEKSSGVRVTPVAYFDDSEEAKTKIMNLKKGTVIAVAGDIGVAAFDRENGVRFMIRVINCELEDKPQKKEK